MMKTIFFGGLLLLLPTLLPAQLRLIIAGNTADAQPGFFAMLDQRLSSTDSLTSVLFAGDFVAECSDDYRSLQPLVTVVEQHPATNFYFIPGDRDWDESGDRGLACVEGLEDYLDGLGLPNLKWPLRKGCPGPELVELSDRVTLMLLNTQWWNHPYDKPVPADADCSFADPSIILDEIKSGIEENQDRNLIIAGHYPPKSQGRYGGSFPGRDHFAPPILGSFRLSYRQNVGTPDELTNVRFSELADELKDYNALYEGLIFVGAQDKSQQLLKFGRNYIINAGAAGAGRWVAKHKPAVHTSREPGFTELSFSGEGAVNYQYINAASGSIARNQIMYHEPCGIRNDTLPNNPAFPPCGVDETAMNDFVVPSADTLTVVPGPQYGRSDFAETFLGTHYRKTWTTPVDVPVLNLANFADSLQPVREGGGRQTTSLRLKAKNGESYVFRSVDKDPAGTLNYEVRNTIIADAVRDQTSSGHPYGGLVVAPLVEQLGILHASPVLYSLAPGPALGDFNPGYGNLLGTLEVRPQGDRKKSGVPGTFGSDEVLKTFELFRARYDDQEVLIDFPEYLRARLFDLLIGDWSRHEDNWRWATFEKDKLIYIRPIPRDRDNAFSLLDGFFPWIADRRWAVPNLENFGFDEPDLRSLSHQARHMDRLLLSSLTREDFLREAEAIRAALTDEVIEDAVREMPAAAFAASGELMIAKLKKRRDDLLTYAEDFYRMHAEVVDVVGTNDEEEFAVTTETDGRVTVTVTDKKGNSAGKVLYLRTFLPGETREIRIYGLGDDDDFVLTGPRKGPISVRIVGGPGDDRFSTTAGGDRGKRVPVYENSKDVNAPGFRGVRNWRPELYYYDRTAFEYNQVVPVAGVGFNSFNGIRLGIGASYTRRNFTRRDYSARYTVYAEGSTIGNAALEGTAEFGQFVRKFDLVARTRLGRPDFYNFFFGLGNFTVKDPEVQRNEFNLVQLQNYTFEAGLRRRFAQRSNFNLMVGYQNNETFRTEGTILDREDPFYGTGDLVFGYLKPELIFDLRDHPKFPSKGVMLEASQKFALGNGVDDFGITKVAAEIHLSTRRFPISLSLRGGFADSQGNAPFYELPSLGRDNGLRGFQRNRFVGDGYVFYEAEFRSPVALIRSRIAPFAVGIRAFYDRGKLLMDDEPDADFKSSTGFGIYIIPLSRSFTISAIAGFSEEESFIINFGAGTNF